MHILKIIALVAVIIIGAISLAMWIWWALFTDADE